MPISLDPKHAILPITKVTPDQSFCGLLGTGFVVGRQPPFVVTAAHVFLDNPLKGDEQFAVFFFRADGQHQMGLIGKYHCSAQHDIAVFGAAGTEGMEPLPILDKPVPSNEDILTFEYSSTVSRAMPDGRVGAHFSPFTHKGNILRHYNEDYRRMSNVSLLDTSFPALQGASGAPVMRASDFAVTGMLIANRERHLIPAQVLTVTTGDHTIEEVKYFLPTGMALSCDVIRPYLDKMGVKYELMARDAG